MHLREKVGNPAIPDQLVAGVGDIDFAALAARGFRHYCFDVDNTLVPQRSEVPAPGALESLRAARAAGYIEGICLLSNTIWGLKKTWRLERIAELFDIPHHLGLDLWARKPHLLGYSWAAGVLGVPTSRIVMVGDQVFTDVLGGNLAGMHTILVNRLSPDHWSTALIGRRFREQWLFRKHGIRRADGGRPPQHQI